MISVIIPTYNEEKAITDCIKSLLNQVKVDYEIIIVDDGSTDQTVSEVSKIKDKRITVLKQSHKGPGLARNFGAKKAKGSILVFADSDMTFDKNFLNELTRPIMEGKTKGTFTKNEFVSNWDNNISRFWNYNLGIRENKRIPFNYPDRAPVFRAILKSEFDKVEGFNVIGYTDDWTLSRKLGYKSETVKGAVCYHKNPETLEEAFIQARWIGKNEFIAKGFKKAVNLIRYSPPLSLLIALIKSALYSEPGFIKFKLVYDQAIFLSIIESFFNKNLYK